jgi:hypothetical protein
MKMLGESRLPIKEGHVFVCFAIFSEACENMCNKDVEPVSNNPFELQ